jgi:aspartyl protease family protein
MRSPPVQHRNAQLLRCTLRVLSALGLTVLAAIPLAAYAAEVALAGVFGSKAVLIINGGAPRTLAVGQRSPEGVRLVEVTPASNAARIEVDGVTRQIRMGQGSVSISATPAAEADAMALTLIADSRGHHYAEGSINGAPLRFIVDTGASAISMGMSDARRARLNLERASPIAVQTASGAVKAWQLRLDTVKVGPLVLHGVDAIVMENDLPIVLLGMSFLSRTEMERDGNRLTLRKRF